jgi:hypothetical protein
MSLKSKISEMNQYTDAIKRSSTELLNLAVMGDKAIVNLEKLADDLHGQAGEIAKSMNEKPGSALHPGQGIAATKSDITDLVEKVLTEHPEFSKIDPQVVGYLYEAVAANRAAKEAYERGEGQKYNALSDAVKRIEKLVQRFDPDVFDIRRFVDLVEQGSTKAITKVQKATNSGSASGGFGVGGLLPAGTSPNLQTLVSTGQVRG